MNFNTYTFSLSYLDSDDFYKSIRRYKLKLNLLQSIEDLDVIKDKLYIDLTDDDYSNLPSKVKELLEIE